MRYATDLVHMHVPPWRREWFTNRNPNIKLSDHELITVKLLNAFQGGVVFRIL